MTNFGEWLFLEEIREELYEAPLRRLQIEEALRKTMDLYNMAVSGQWNLIENDLDDDGPAELDDPFTGDETASPVEETPDDKKIRRAQKIQRLARMVRWAAMLDRRDTVAKVAEIYKNELLPLLSQNEWVNINESDDDDWGVPEFKKRDRTSDDDDWGVPEFKSQSQSTNTQAPSVTQKNRRESSLAAIQSRLRPLLEKLGYLKEGELDYGTTEEKANAIVRAAKAAAAEKGNDPPDNEDVRSMAADENLRNRISQDMMGEVIRILQRTAEKTYRQIRRKHNFDGGESKYGAEMDEGDILSRGLEANMRKLQTRRVNKDGTARDWDDDLTILTTSIDTDEDAAQLINTIKSPISTPERALRDERREARKASGLAPGSNAIFTCSQCGHTRSVAPKLIGTSMKCPKCQGEGVVQQGASVVSHDAGATGEDGAVTSMDPVDTKTSDSLTNASMEETAKELVDAFRQSMAELKEKDPSQAVLACLWLGLHGNTPANCSAPDGSIPDHQAANRFRDAARGIGVSAREAPAMFLRKIGLDSISAGEGRGRSGRANWELVRMIKLNNIPAVGKLAGIPNGDLPPDWVPNYTQRHMFDANQQMWWKYMNRIIDTLSKKTLPFIMTRMSEILAEKNPLQKPKGWESPCSWSIMKFLKETFRESIRSGTVAITGSNPISVVFYNLHEKSREIRSYTVTIDSRQIKIVQKGWEQDVHSYDLPTYDVKCSKCNGVGRGCSECEGCGSTMDRLKVLKTENEIHARLITRRISRPSKSR